MANNKVLDITKDVKWIGILDYDIRQFDIIMTTDFGSTYNSYFINADKKTIVDSAKEKFRDDYLQKVHQVVDPKEIEYIIVNHTEPDHSGCIRYLLELAPNATVVGSNNAIKYLHNMIGPSFKSLSVKEGDSLDLGNKTLKFISAPNLHWPDSIYTYLEEDNLLFTCDSFGSHFCHEDMFDDKVGNFDEAFKYYFDVILKPYSKFLLKAIEKIGPLKINAICTGHGPILRKNWKKYVDLSKEYAEKYVNSTEAKHNRILIAYVSAHGYTKEMASFIAQGIKENSDLYVELLDIEYAEIGSIESRIILSDALLIGSPTLNQNILLPTYKIFAVINPIRDKKKLASSFGSYGWSGEGVSIINGILKSLKLDTIDGLSMKFKPIDSDVETLKEFGKSFANTLKEKLAAEE